MRVVGVVVYFNTSVKGVKFESDVLVILVLEKDSGARDLTNFEIQCYTERPDSNYCPVFFLKGTLDAGIYLLNHG